MIKYQRNNILFRIASADAISKFKKAQASSFLQLTRKELQFDSGPKEAVLLEFDRFSQWLFRIERICLASGNAKLTEELKEAMIESFYDEIVVIESVMIGHKDIFPAKMTEFAKCVHNYSKHMLDKIFAESIDLRIDVAFTNIAEALSDYLQHTLLTFHEYNNNVIKNYTEPFICCSSFCISKNHEHFLPLKERIEFFKHTVGASEFILKNFTPSDIHQDVVDSLGDVVTLTQELKD